MDFDKAHNHHKRVLIDKNYKLGYDDGLESASSKAYQNGFREGVQVFFY